MNERIRIRFVINPISGVGRQKVVERLIPEYLSTDQIQFDIVYTEHAGHARDLAKKAAEEKVDIVAIVGGDGSVNEAGSALAGTETALAIIPTGSGNGIARHHKIPLKLPRAIQLLNQNKIIKTDVGLINDRAFIGFAGIGFDARIAHAFAKGSKRGMWGYTKMVIREIRKFKGPDIFLPGKAEAEKNNFIVTFANVSEYGNGFTIDPMADAGDGQLSCSIIKHIPLIFFPFTLIKSRRGLIHKSRYFRQSVFSDSSFSIPGLKEAHVDGEGIIIEGNRIHVRVSDQKLKLVCPIS